MKDLIFSTGNELKYAAASEVCSAYNIKLIQKDLDIDEIQSEDAEKIVIDKANKAYDLLGSPVLVSDDNWSIPGLNGFPGPYMKSINEWLNPENFINLTRPLSDRRVFLEAYLAYKDQGQIKVFHLSSEGILMKEARGSQGVTSHQTISMLGDDGLSIAEVFDQESSNFNDRLPSKLWQQFAQWYNQL